MGNHNSGRRPSPTALHVLKGNPSRKNLNINEVCPPAGEIGKPEGLSAGAGRMWDELGPVCLAMGTLTTADLRVFATLCELQAAFSANARLKDLSPGSFDQKVELELANRLRPFYEYFGMTPSARARISVPKKAEEPQSKWAGVLK